MADAEQVPDPVGGKVIRASWLSMLGMIAGAAFMAAACGLLLWDRWWSPEDATILPFRLTWWGSALAGVGFGIGVLGLIALPFELLFPKQVVLGDDAFQVVRAGMSGPVVEVHIPYANIAAVEHEKPDPEGSWRVGIDLHDTADPETYSKHGELNQKKKAGRDYCLEGGYVVSLGEIARLIEKRCRKARRAARDE